MTVWVVDLPDDDLDTLRRMAVDATAYRLARGSMPCPVCAVQRVPCAEHTGHRDLASLYQSLASDLGLGPVTAYAVQAQPSEHGYALHIEGLGVTQAPSLAEAPAMVADFVALQTGIPADSIAVDLTAAGPVAGGYAVAAEAIEPDAARG